MATAQNGSTSASETRRRPRLAPFIAGDPVRAIAALSVLGYHAALTAMSTSGYTNFSPAGFTGPYGSPGRLLFGLEHGLFLFFVLSGYLIARPFVQAFIAGDVRPAVRPYLRNRALRILPLFWFVTTAVLIRYGSEGSSPLEVLGVYGFAQNSTHEPAWVNSILAPAWTLQVEVGFYLLVPLVAVAARRLVGGRLDARGRVRFVLGLAGAVLAVSLALRQAVPDSVYSLRQIPVTLFAFMPGVALAAIEPSAKAGLASGRWRWLRPWWLVPFGLGLMVVELFLPVGDNGLRGLLVAAATMALVGAPLLVQWRGEPAWRWLDSRPLQWVGARSYSVYLLQVPLIAEIVDLQSGGARVRFFEMLAMASALTLPASALTYRFVEQPFLRRRARRGRPPREPDLVPDAGLPAPAHSAAGSP